MDTQLNDQLVYASEALFGINERNLINNCSETSVLPELKLDDDDTVFADNLTSADCVTSAPHLTYLSDSTSVTSSPFAVSSGQDIQTSSRFHPYPRSPSDEPQTFDRSGRYQVPFQPSPYSNPHSFEGYQAVNASPVYVDASHRVIDLSQMHAQEQLRDWSASSASYVMNSNNNNINQLSTSDSVVFRPSHTLQSGGVSERNERAQVQSLPVNSPVFKTQLTRKAPYVNSAQCNPRELLGAKFSPDGKKKNKKRKKRGSNEPQKPVSAYALFFRDTQASIKIENPSATFGEISKIVASLWDGLSEEAKQVYKQKTETAKRDYLKQLAAFRANLVSKGGLEAEEDEDNHQSMSIFKANDQRLPVSSSSFYTPAKIHLLPSNAKDLTRQQMTTGYMIPNSQVQKLVNINVMCEPTLSQQSGHMMALQQSMAPSHFMAQASSEASPPQG